MGSCHHCRNSRPPTHLFRLQPWSISQSSEGSEWTTRFGDMKMFRAHAWLLTGGRTRDWLPSRQARERSRQGRGGKKEKGDVPSGQASSGERDERNQKKRQLVSVSVNLQG